MYSIEFTKVALKQLLKLETGLQKRIIASLERIRVRPYPHVKRLVSGSYFRLKVGKHRVILDVIDNRLVIVVVEVGHRRNIYK